MMAFALLGVLIGLCAILPARFLIVLSVLGVLLADTAFVSGSAIYFSRFVPSGVLALRAAGAVFSGRSITGNSMIKAWLPFFILAVVSVGYSIDRSLSGQRLVSALFALVGFGAGIPLFLGRFGQYQRHIRHIGVLVGGVVLYSLYLVSQGGGSFQAAGRIKGAFNNANTLGLMAMQAAFLTFFWWQGERDPIRRRLFLGALIGVMMTLIVTGSRASFLGLTVGMLTIYWAKARIEGRTVRQISQGAVVAVFVLLIAESLAPQTLDMLFRTESSGRIALWQRSWELAQDNLIFGVGFAASDEVFHADIPYLKSRRIYVTGSHSSILRLLVDLGLVGVGLAAFAFWQMLRRSWRLLPHFDDPLLGASLLAVVLASLTNSFFEGWLFGFGAAPTVPFWVFLATLAHQTDLARRKIAISRKQRIVNGLVASPVTS